MTFTLTGPVGGRRASVTWAGGEVTGDATVRARAEVLARAGAAVGQTVTGPWRKAGLDDPVAAALTLKASFDGPVEASGDAPRLDASLPAGAVA